MNPFTGLDHEDPYTHLNKFYEIFGTLGAPEVEEEPMFMRLIPYSLIGKAKEWYLDQPTQTMTDWNVLEEKFLDRFFPQQLKEIQELPNKHQQVSSYELCNGDHHTGYCPPGNGEVNYMGN